MSFIEYPRFPAGISNGAQGGPTFNSRVFSVQNGDETVIALWDAPLHEFDVAFGVKSAAQLDVVRAIFWNVRGQAHQFRYKDWNDYAFDFTRGILVATDVDGVYQLGKTYSFGPITTHRKVVKPVVGSMSLAKLVSGTYVVIDASTYTIDYRTGLVTFADGQFPSGGDVLAAAGEYDTPARFNTDSMLASIDSFDIQSWGQIPLKEVRRIAESIGMPVAPTEDYGNGAPPPVSGGGSPEPTPPPAPTATTVLASGPASGIVGRPATFAFSLDGTPAAPVHVPLHGFGTSGAEGTWSPSTITLTGATVVHATYSAATAGNKTLTRTNDGGLSSGPNLSFNAFASLALTLDPATATTAPGTAEVYTVGSNAPLDNATVVTLHTDASGGTTGAPVTLGPGHSDSATIARTPAANGTETITLTNDQGIANPPAAALTVQTAPTSIALSPSTQNVTVGTASGTITATLDHPAIAAFTAQPTTTGSGGSFAPTTPLAFSVGDVSKTFTRTPSAAGTETIGVTNTGGLSSNTVAIVAAAAPPPAGGSETALTPGTPQTFNMNSGDTAGYYVDVPAGRSTFELDGSGQSPGVAFDAYARFGAAATTTVYDFTIDVAGKATTSHVVNSPSAGRWHILVRANATFTGGRLLAQLG